MAPVFFYVKRKRWGMGKITEGMMTRVVVIVYNY
jgi:hypothetical protein